MADQVFELALDRYVERVKKDADVAVRNVVMTIFSNIIRLTPVDTGWARANWYASVNQKLDVEGASRPEDETGPFEPPDPGPAVAAGKAGDIFYLQNGVPYILALEHGWSGQAPYGMVTVAFESARAFINAYASGEKLSEARAAAFAVPGANQVGHRQRFGL